ncbi:hypothetical protein LUZ60_006615 [Juncus effusus]|nr:hypothetical protein LUZ60_006615 [Juncus effusus]
MFSESSTSLPWDINHAYTRDAVELYYQAGVGNVMKKKEMLKYFLEGSVDSNALADVLSEEIDEEKDRDDDVALSNSKDSGTWIKINERKTLLEVLQQKEYIIPALPVFYVVSNKSSFYKEFKSGKWCPP